MNYFTAEDSRTGWIHLQAVNKVSLLVAIGDWVILELGLLSCCEGGRGGIGLPAWFPVTKAQRFKSVILWFFFKQTQLYYLTNGYWGWDGGWGVLYDKVNWESPMTLTISI